MVVKTFRGILADGGQDRIRLSTTQGKTGYRIVKFELMPKLPGTVAAEHVIQIFKTEQSSVPTTNPTVDFTNSDLLGVAVVGNSTNATQYSPIGAIIFDDEIFNQDVYVTHTEANASEECNYYLELEVILLSDMAAEYTTIKDLRGYTRMNPFH